LHVQDLLLPLILAHFIAHGFVFTS
jgi:hypothetical protein